MKYCLLLLIGLSCMAGAQENCTTVTTFKVCPTTGLNSWNCDINDYEHKAYNDENVAAADGRTRYYDGSRPIATRVWSVRQSCEVVRPSTNTESDYEPWLPPGPYMGIGPAAFDEDGCHDVNYYMLAALPGFVFGNSITATIDSEDHNMCAGWTVDYFTQVSPYHDFGGCVGLANNSSAPSAGISDPNGDGTSSLIAARAGATHKICVEPFDPTDEWTISIFVTPPMMMAPGD